VSGDTTLGSIKKGKFEFAAIEGGPVRSTQNLPETSRNGLSMGYGRYEWAGSLVWEEGDAVKNASSSSTSSRCGGEGTRGYRIWFDVERKLHPKNLPALGGKRVKRAFRT